MNSIAITRRFSVSLLLLLLSGCRHDDPVASLPDYNGIATSTGITGVAMPAGYSAAVAVAQSSLNGIAATESLLITVTVTHGGDSITLEGYRTRYSPNF